MISRSVPNGTAPRNLLRWAVTNSSKVGAFGLTSGDPHRGLKARSAASAAWGWLPWNHHPGDPVALQHGLDLVRANLDRSQSFADRRSGHAVRAGQRGGRQRVGHVVREPPD